MPNWCNNDLTISGNKLDLKKFYDENFEDDCLKFYKSVPLPKDEDSEDPDDTFENDENWGTKWDIDKDDFDGYLDLESCEIGANFNTAWTPPLQWLNTVCELYPTLQFKLLYGEMGMDFAGRVLCENGDMVENEEGTYDEYYGGDSEDEDTEDEDSEDEDSEDSED